MTRKRKRTIYPPQVERQDDETDEPKSFTHGHCVVCGTPLCTTGGCAGTGMCGPCCTGSAEDVGEF